MPSRPKKHQDMGCEYHYSNKLFYMNSKFLPEYLGIKATEMRATPASIMEPEDVKRLPILKLIIKDYIGDQFSLC